jgi:hypothetical protein
MPILQVGGVQEAMIVDAPDVVDAVIRPVLLTVADAVSDELQVSGVPLMVVPTVSMMVGTTVLEVLVAAVTVSVIVCTGQVVK